MHSLVSDRTRYHLHGAIGIFISSADINFLRQPSLRYAEFSLEIFFNYLNYLVNLRHASMGLSLVLSCWSWKSRLVGSHAELFDQSRDRHMNFLNFSSDFLSKVHGYET